MESNREPGDTELSEVQGKLDLASAELQAFSSHVDSCQEVLDQLKHERARHQEAIRLHQSVVSVIRRLPDDIIRLIFLKLIEDTRSRDIMCGAWPSLCSLSQVSQRWRAVALSTPSLWANICVQSNFNNNVSRYLTSVISICLYRSCDTPLRVLFELDGRGLSQAPSRAQSAFESLCSNASRWKHFELRAYGASIMRHCLNSVRSLSAPTLEHLTLYLTQDDSQETIPFILNAPALRHVYLINNVVPCPWEQLTSFRYTSISSSTDFVEILPRLSQLRKLDMAIDASTDLALSLTVLPNLHTLTFRGRPRQVHPSPQGLQHLILPALADLKLIDFWDSRLLTVLEQSRCSLKRFEWKFDYIALEPFRQLLEVSSTLEEVTLIIVPRMGSSVRELIPLFACRPDIEVFLPNLRLIDISRSDYEEWPQDGILLTMVESRIAHKKGLVVHLPHVELDDVVKQRVDDLQKKGCTLKLIPEDDLEWQPE